MDIKGGYAKPHWTDVLWVQLVILPLTVYRWALWCSLHWNKALICRWTKFYVLWLWRFGILREEYGREEQLYVIRFPFWKCASVKIKLPLPRKNLGVSQGQFDQLEEEEVEEMLELELWEKDKFAVWKEEKEAEKRIKMAQSGRWDTDTYKKSSLSWALKFCYRYKQYRRYMKNHGADRMTFED